MNLYEAIKKIDEDLLNTAKTNGCAEELELLMSAAWCVIHEHGEDYLS